MVLGSPFVRFLTAMGVIVGASVGGWYLQGWLLAPVAFFAASCITVGVLFFLQPRCDSCGSARLNHIGDSPRKCVECGHVQMNATGVSVSESSRQGYELGARREKESRIPKLQLFSVFVFGVGVALSIYSILTFSPPALSDPGTWETAWLSQTAPAIVGLALSTVGLLLYVESLKLVPHGE